MQNKIKPSKFYYFLGTVLLIASVILFSIQVVSAIVRFSNSGQRVLAPGKSELNLEEAGRYTIFYEYRSSFNGTLYSTSSENLSSLMGRVYNVDTASQIELRQPSINSTYSLPGREGVSVFEFYLDKPALVILETIYKSGNGPEIVLNISKNFVLGMLMRIGISFIMMSILGVLGIVTVVLTAIKRRKFV